MAFSPLASPRSEKGRYGTRHPSSTSNYSLNLPVIIQPGTAFPAESKPQTSLSTPKNQTRDVRSQSLRNTPFKASEPSEVGHVGLASVQPMLMTMRCEQLRARCEGVGWCSMRRAIRWGMVHKERVLNVEIVQGADCAVCTVERNCAVLFLVFLNMVEVNYFNLGNPVVQNMKSAVPKNSYLQ